jgi:hypothetical protein
MSAAALAVTVAATSVTHSSTMPGVAAAEPSNEMPHSRILMICVAPGLTCSSVLIAVPVVTEGCAAAAAIGPFENVYSAIQSPTSSPPAGPLGRSACSVWA